MRMTASMESESTLSWWPHSATSSSKEVGPWMRAPPAMRSSSCRVVRCMQQHQGCPGGSSFHGGRRNSRASAIAPTTELSTTMVLHQSKHESDDTDGGSWRAKCSPGRSKPNSLMSILGCSPDGPAPDEPAFQSSFVLVRPSWTSGTCCCCSQEVPAVYSMCILLHTHSGGSRTLYGLISANR